MELLFEIIFEIYIELMMYIVPEEKATSKKHKIIAILVAIVVLLITLCLFIWGCILISDYNNKSGAIHIFIAVIISIGQIVAGFILHDKKSKK